MGNAPWAAEKAVGMWPFCGIFASALSHCRGLLVGSQCVTCSEKRQESDQQESKCSVLVTVLW